MDLVVSVRRNRRDPAREYIIRNYEEWKNISVEISTAYKEV
jgi:hypothetical protein